VVVSGDFRRPVAPEEGMVSSSSESGGGGGGSFVDGNKDPLLESMGNSDTTTTAPSRPDRPARPSRQAASK
jgi:hypothetical protein